METDLIVYIRRGVILVAVVLIGMYSYYQALPFLSGPHLEITEPIDGSSIATSSIFIYGNTERISTLTLNDREIFIDEAGNFGQKLLLPLGYTIIEMTARDRFNRSVSKTVHVVRTQ